MATIGALAQRYAVASERINRSLAAVAVILGVEIADNDYSVRDAEVRRVVEIETTAANFEKIHDFLQAAKTQNAEEIKMGELSDDFPHVEILREQDVKTYEQVRELKASGLVKLKDIGDKRADEILTAANLSPD